MKNIIRFNAALMVLGLMMLSGCSSTRLITSWRDDTFPAIKLKKPMVVAVIPKEIIRVRLEDELVLGLKEAGIDAVQSYRSFSGEKVPDVDNLRAKIAELQNDSVLVVRLVDVQTDTAYVPGATQVSVLERGPNYSNFGSRDFGGYYTRSYNVASTPGYTYEYTLYTLEMNLYDAKSEKHLWTAVTETEIITTVDAALRDLANTGIDNLKKHELLLK